MKPSLHSLASLGITGLLAFTSGCASDRGSSAVSKDAATFVLKHARVRETECVLLGTKLKLVAAVKTGGPGQWVHDGVPIPGAHATELILDTVTTNEVGFYSYVASGKKGLELIETPSFELQAMSTNMGGGPIIVWGKPGPPGGTSGTCPGAYVALVNYKPKVGYGWAPGDIPHIAEDGSAATIGCSRIEYLGDRGSTGCDFGRIPVPHPTVPETYRFTLYFPMGCSYSSSHPLVLTGFR